MSQPVTVVSVSASSSLNVPVSAADHVRAWRRGMRELDLLIGRFAESRLASLTPDEMDQFEALLDVPDPDMLAWLTGAADVEPEHDTPIYRALVAFHVHQGPLNL